MFWPGSCWIQESFGAVLLSCPVPHWFERSLNFFVPVFWWFFFFYFSAVLGCFRRLILTPKLRGRKDGGSVLISFNTQTLTR